jgi:pilus assembly protein CpaE
MPRLKAKQVDLYAVADDFAPFDGVSDALDLQCGPSGWAVIGLEEMRRLLDRAVPEGLAEIVLAVDARDESRLREMSALIGAAKAAGLSVILLLKDVSPGAMHALMRAGALDFIPYPAPEGLVADTLARIRERDLTAAPAPGVGRKGVILPVFSMSGGAGGTTFAVNLAYELALETRKADARVCLIDLDFQFGSVSTYLDMPRQEALIELLATAGIGGIDRDGLAGAFATYKRHLSVITSPVDSMPMDIVSSEEIDRVLTLCAAAFDYVVVDLPHTMTGWTERVLHHAETFFAITGMDMRSAQNTLRFLRLLKSEELPLEKLEFVMNRAPGFADFGGRSRMKRMAESLGVEYALTLPDGGRQVVQACDQGQTLAQYAGGNALRKQIKRIAQSVKLAAEKRKAGGL